MRVLESNSVKNKYLMKQKICRFILKIFGWEAELKVKIPDKCIFCVAPHTSNCDFIIGKLMYTMIHQKVFFLFCLVFKEFFEKEIV